MAAVLRIVEEGSLEDVRFKCWLVGLLLGSLMSPLFFGHAVSFLQVIFVALAFSGLFFMVSDVYHNYRKRFVEHEVVSVALIFRVFIPYLVAIIPPVMIFVFASMDTVGDYWVDGRLDWLEVIFGSIWL
jgi:uncharacterized membrane protein YcaP (DUF421 family)